MSGHAPVMLAEVVEALAPRDGGVYVDCTFGAGGYSRAILGAADCRVVAFDRDPSARAAGALMEQAFPGRFRLVSAPFSEMQAGLQEAGESGADGVVFDLGVSSMQLDEADRGFSFRFDGPLDMRMARQGPSAADAVTHLPARDLEAIFRVYGEEKKARRAAHFIERARAEAPIETTQRLAEIVRAAVGVSPKSKIDPATRVFQALRIYVNDELGELARGLAAAEQILRPAGRLVVVAFHSLEDRIVKLFLRARAGRTPAGSRHAPPAEHGPAPSFSLVMTGALAPGEAEAAENPRARSARLRAAVRTTAPAWAGDLASLLPNAPSLSALEAVL
jgi:16S rRNA (cytosine1402-N4)-methyltransferase